MRHAIFIPVLAALFILAASLSSAQPPKPPAGKPAPKKPDAALEKVKALGEHLGRALDLTIDLLSGNKAALFSGNSANLLSGNTPKILSENQTPIFSGNKISLFSNFKVEIHIEGSGNGSGAPLAVRSVPTYVPGAGGRGTPRASNQVEQPSSGQFQPPSLPR